MLVFLLYHFMVDMDRDCSNILFVKYIYNIFVYICIYSELCQILIVGTKASSTLIVDLYRIICFSHYRLQISMKLKFYEYEKGFDSSGNVNRYNLANLLQQKSGHYKIVQVVLLSGKVNT